MRRLRLALAAVCAASVASGCLWPQVGNDAGRRGSADASGIDASNVASLAPLWSATVPAGASSPVIAGGAIFVAAGNTVTAFPGGGNIAWQRVFEDPQPGFTLGFGTPALINDRIAVPVSTAGFGGMYTFDRATGDSSGGLNFHEFASAAPAVREGVVALTSGGYGSGGPVLYTITYAGKIGFVSYGDFSAPAPGVPMIAGNFVYVTAGAQLLAFQLDTCPDLPPANAFFYCAPTWASNLGSNGGMPVSLSSGSVAVPLANGNIAVVDATTGVLQWTAITGSTSVQSPAVSPSGVFYTGTADGRVRGFPVAGCGAATCTSVWSGNAGAQVSSQPVVSAGVVYAGTVSGNVAAFTEGGCAGPPCAPVVAVSVTAGPTTIIPVIYDGRLVAVATTGKIAVFKPA